MKIILVGTAYPLRGGLAAFNERLISQFIREGHDASIRTFSLQYPEFLFPGKTQYSADDAPDKLPIEVCINSINPFNWLWQGLRLRKAKPDILIFKFWLPFMAPCFGTIIRIAKLNRHTKVICIADNIVPHETRFFDKPFIKYFVKSCDGFISMSESVKNDLFRFRPKAKHQLVFHPVYDNFGNGVEKAIARNFFNLKTDDKVILFFGFIRRYKGLDLLLKAMADLRIRQAGIRLIIAGEYYEDKTFYTQLIDDLGIADLLIMKDDFIPNEEVKMYFSAADLVVQPYRSATQSGITQLAYHFEKPMVVTNVGGLPELVPHHIAGYVCEPDENHIADAIMDFYADGNMLKFNQGIMQEKKKYRWENLTRAVVELSSE